MGKIGLKLLDKTSPFRKVAMGTWRVAKDPSVYGYMEVDVTRSLEMIEDYSRKKGVRVTLTHLVGKAVAHCLNQRPEINGMIRGSRIYLRDNVTLFFQVNIPGKGPDKVKEATLSGCTVENAENLSSAEIADKIQKKVELIRSHKDPEFSKNMDMFKFIPWFLCGWYLDLASFLIYGLNWDLNFLGLPRDPFGSVMITNVGSLGIDVAYAPLCPYTRVPLLVTVGAVKKKPWVVDDQIQIRQIMSVTVTFDHRMIDGIHAAKLSEEFKKCFENPEDFLLKE
jgi:pyruvate/2-oxoglutarate dehydrogenase complex dihydrolipoamide acyltransferase (E2) component